MEQFYVTGKKVDRVVKHSGGEQDLARQCEAGTLAASAAGRWDKVEISA
jgi:hypothetical protein